MVDTVGRELFLCAASPEATDLNVAARKPRRTAIETRAHL